MADGILLKEAVHAQKIDDIESSVNRNSSSEKHQRVVIQAKLDLTTKTDDVKNIDLWYTGAYELSNSDWNLIELAELKTTFLDKITFQPRMLNYRGTSYPAKDISKNCILNGKYCPVLPIDHGKLLG